MFWLLKSNKTANITEKWKGKTTKFVIVNESPNILPQNPPLDNIIIFCIYASSALTTGWGPT